MRIFTIVTTRTLTYEVPASHFADGEGRFETRGPIGHGNDVTPEEAAAETAALARTLGYPSAVECARYELGFADEAAIGPIPLSDEWTITIDGVPLA